MEELVQDLVSALEQTTQQVELDELWEEMVFRPLRHRRPVRKRRGRKRHCDFRQGRCLSEGSESSLDEAFSGNYRYNAAAAMAMVAGPVLASNHSDSDETVVARRRTASALPLQNRQHSWPESDSFTENNPGRPLRRRRKVKRMPINMTVRLQTKFRLSASERGHQSHHYRHQKSDKKRRLAQIKRRSRSWSKQDNVPVVIGARGRSQEGWRDKILQQSRKEREAADENMSECESSSVCSSDPGLFTNDEGRQGDDEQSDWFFDGECGPGNGVLANKESEMAPRPPTINSKRTKQHSATFQNQKGYHTRVKRLPGMTACCIKKGRRRLTYKDNSVAVCVDKLRHHPQDSYQNQFWMPHYEKHNRTQLKPLCSLSMYSVGMVPDSSLTMYSSNESRRQRSAHVGLQRAGDVKKRERTVDVPTFTAAYLPFHKESRLAVADECSVTEFSLDEEQTPALLSTSHAQDFIKPQPSFSSHREREDV